MGFVYVMRGNWHGATHKIGSTGQALEERWTAREMLERIVVVIPTDEPITLERELHNHFAAKRVGQAEAFNLSEADLEAIKSWGSRGKDDRLECLRCEHRWHRRTELPIQCPRCKSINWNRPKPETKE